LPKSIKKSVKKTSSKKKTVKKAAKTFPAKLKKKTSRRPAQTMEELLAQTGYQLHGFKRGDSIEGIITEKTKKAIYLDIGGKTEGMVIDREMKAARDFIDGLAIGDKVRAIVTQPENDRGQTLLSLKKAASDYLWTNFEEKLKTGEPLKVRGREVNRGGLIVNARGLQGFIPASQFGSETAGQIDGLVNKEVEVKVIEINRKKNRLIFSEREVSEAGLLKAQKAALKKVKIGDEFSGEVTGVMAFGLFVRVKLVKAEVEGLVHISEISWEKVEDPSKFYQEGDEVKVKVLDVDEKSGRLNFSIKQLKTDPWKKVKKKYPVVAKIKGEVVKLAPFGAFVRLEPGVEGLIHLSKIPVEKSLKVGDKVDCYVESIGEESRRMSLGLVLKEKPVDYK